MFCFTRSKKYGERLSHSLEMGFIGGCLCWNSLLFRFALGHQCWHIWWLLWGMRIDADCNSGWMKEWGFPPPVTFSCLKRKQTILTKRPLANLQVASSSRGKRESCDPWCPYYFWKTTPWMTYNFEIMKKVVTLQNGIGLWSRKLVLKPKAFL